LEQQKLKEQKQKEQEEENNGFDEMSVDQLNSLTPEQRRDQMLQALQKRTNTEQS
jgi:coupling of ubiquitin conjugation to ER degradation protein 1